MPDKALDATGAVSVASDKSGILSEVPILDACSILLGVSDKFDTPVWYLFFDVSGSAYVVGNVSHCNIVLYLTKLLMPQVLLVLHLASVVLSVLCLFLKLVVLLLFVSDKFDTLGVVSTL